MKSTAASAGAKVSIFDKIQLFFKELYIKIKKYLKRKGKSIDQKTLKIIRNHCNAFIRYFYVCTNNGTS